MSAQDESGVAVALGAVGLEVVRLRGVESQLRDEISRLQATLASDSALADWEKRGVISDSAIAMLREARAEVERLRGAFDTTRLLLADAFGVDQGQDWATLLMSARQMQEDAYRRGVLQAEAALDKAKHQDAALSLLRELRGYITPTQEQFAPVLGRIDALLNDKP